MEKINFDNYGFTQHRFSVDELEPLRHEVYKILSNFSAYKSQKFNSELVGQLKKEYLLAESKQYMSNLLMPHVEYYCKEFDFLKLFNYNLVDSPIVLNSLWVNFQQKYEFNPVHDHSGIITFVIYLDIPYTMEDEQKISPGANASECLAGQFEFLYNDSLGGIKQHPIPLDKTYENVMIMFPAKIKHCAYSFYSSKEYRISVSGNFIFNNT